MRGLVIGVLVNAIVDIPDGVGFCRRRRVVVVVVSTIPDVSIVDKDTDDVVRRYCLLVVATAAVDRGIVAVVVLSTYASVGSKGGSDAAVEVGCCPTVVAKRFLSTTSEG
jgi:hypothetical protein